MRSKLLVLLVLVSLLLGSCSPAAQNQATTVPVTTPKTETSVGQQPASGDQITLRVYVVDFAMGTTDKWFTDTVVPEFQKIHPNVNVEFIWGSWSTFDATLAGYFAANEGPDIINLGSEYNGLYGNNLAPLNQYLGPEAWPEINNFVPSTLNNVSWEGELRGLPIMTAPRYVFCRKDLMAEAGVTQQPTNFAEWVDFTKKLTKVDPNTNALTQQGFFPMDAGTMADFQWFYNTIWSLGGSLYKEDGITPNFDSPEAKAALKFNYDIRKAVYPERTIAGLPALASGTLLDDGGGAVCAWHSGWGAPALALEDGSPNPIWEKIDIQPFTGDPVNFPNSQPVVLSFVDWWAVPAYSKNVEMAAEFLKFVFSKENNYKYNETMKYIPAREDAQIGYVQENPAMKREAELAAQYGIGYSNILETSALRDIVQKELGAGLTDQQDLETTLKNIQEQYTEALRKAGHLE